MRLFRTELRRSMTQLTTLVILAVFGLCLLGIFDLVHSDAPWSTVAELTEMNKLPFGFLLPLLVAVAIAAVVAWTDFLTGSISNQLTFTPNRAQVLGAKLGATALISLVIALIGQAAAIGFPWLAKSTITDKVEPYPAGFWTNYLTTAGYQIGIVVVAAVIVAALTHLFRNALPVIGIGALVIGATSMDLPPEGWARFLPAQLMYALFDGKVEYAAFDLTTFTNGDPQVVLTRATATWIVAAVLALVLGLTFWRYQVRDVTD
jgi:hypothetical protein